MIKPLTFGLVGLLLVNLLAMVLGLLDTRSYLDLWIFGEVVVFLGLAALWRLFMNKGDKEQSELMLVDNNKIKKDSSPR